LPVSGAASVRAIVRRPEGGAAEVDV